ncbi:XKR6 [Cordylochernes scorpioides]|uniref:XK-related protein n=1 Tax=Cordylochernes scorpioides TaxID=51811 RepID=A0ABY6JYW4_9ARAC|nr:XKR6 [Cordylochernes scorpioides]
MGLRSHFSFYCYTFDRYNNSVFIFFLISTQSYQGIKLVELVDGVCWGCVFFFLISTQSYQGIKLVDGVCWGCVFFLLISTQSYYGIKLVELVDGVCWGCVFFLISTQSYQGIKLVELVDGVCWGCVFHFLISTQSYYGIKLVELVDGVCCGCVFFFLISTQSYQGIKLVDGVCWGCVFFLLISTQSYYGIKLVELVDGVCWGCVFFFLISTQSYQGIKLVELVDGVCWGCVFFFLISTQSYYGIKLVELVDDTVVALKYFLHGHLAWGLLTVFFTALSSATINIFSLRWLLEDSRLTSSAKLTHWLQLGLFYRYWERWGMRRRRDKLDNPQLRAEYYQQCSDLCMLRLFESFLEAAPQLVLQLYIMFLVPETSWLSWTGVCVVASLISLGLGVMSYGRALREQGGRGLSWVGSLAVLFWRLGTLTSRVLSLVLLCRALGLTAFLLLMVRWVAMTTWAYFQGTDFCPTWWEERLYNGVIGAIYCFCWFNVQEGRSRTRCTKFYMSTAAENLACVAVYYYLSAGSTPWPGVVVLVSFILGLASMGVYFRFFHPSGPITLWRPAAVPQIPSDVAPGDTLRHTLKYSHSVKVAGHHPSVVVRRENSPDSSTTSSRSSDLSVDLGCSLKCIQDDHTCHSLNCSVMATPVLPPVSRHRVVNYNFRAMNNGRVSCSCTVLQDLGRSPPLLDQQSPGETLIHRCSEESFSHFHRKFLWKVLAKHGFRRARSCSTFGTTPLTSTPLLFIPIFKPLKAFIPTIKPLKLFIPNLKPFKPFVPNLKPLKTFILILKPLKTPNPILKPLKAFNPISKPLKAFVLILKPLKLFIPILKPLKAFNLILKPLKTPNPILKSLKTPTPILKPLQIHNPILKPLKLFIPILKPLKAFNPILKPLKAFILILKPLKDFIPILKPLKTPNPILKSLKTFIPILKPLTTPNAVLKSLKTPNPILKSLKIPNPILKSLKLFIPILKPLKTPNPILKPLKTPNPILKTLKAFKPILKPLKAFILILKSLKLFILLFNLPISLLTPLRHSTLFLTLLKPDLTTKLTFDISIFFPSSSWIILFAQLSLNTVEPPCKGQHLIAELKCLLRRELTAIGRVPRWQIGERPSDMKASCETSRITLTNKQSLTNSNIVRRGVDFFKNPDFN